DERRGHVRRAALRPRTASHARHPLCLDVDRAPDLSRAHPAGGSRNRCQLAVFRAGVELRPVLLLWTGVCGGPHDAAPDDPGPVPILARGAPDRHRRVSRRCRRGTADLMIRVRNLKLTFSGAHGQRPAVNGVSLDIAQGEFYTLLGPSGCGKTTTLRCIAGLERPDVGEITVGNELVCSSERGIWVEPHRRRIGMVFQSYAIWPHMTVLENVAFPLR